MMVSNDIFRSLWAAKMRKCRTLLVEWCFFKQKKSDQNKKQTPDAASPGISSRVEPPKFNMSPLKRDHFKREPVFQPPCFRKRKEGKENTPTQKVSLDGKKFTYITPQKMTNQIRNAQRFFLCDLYDIIFIYIFQSFGWHPTPTPFCSVMGWWLWQCFPPIIMVQ